ncbi:MAG: Ribonuclease [Candidatus Taylorbacteria bacterium]|nr:Ribonuclease [Candidatus Taylorbacteria bacterium]
MFPQSHRLSRADVSNVIKSGRVIHTLLFSVRILSVVTPHFKCAFVISKKELKLSVDRNMAKRKARMVLREISTELSPVYFVVFVKKTILKADFKEVVDEYRKVFKA